MERQNQYQKLYFKKNSALMLLYFEENVYETKKNKKVCSFKG